MDACILHWLNCVKRAWCTVRAVGDVRLKKEEFMY